MNSRFKEHSHVWEDYIENATAYYSKRDDGKTNDKFWATGEIKACHVPHCHVYWFIPTVRSLSAVEVILEAQ